VTDEPFDLLPDTDWNRAFAIAAREHRGQVDKVGLPYLLAHVCDVVNRLDGCEDDDAVTVAWLHDVLEDGHDPAALEAELRRSFSERVVDAVLAITHRPGESRDDYYARVKASPLAHRVKLADLDSNTDPIRMALLPADLRERLTKKYDHARKVLGVPS
jgi:(p)ppGpp synthase/HD superfamily hydrolase